MSRFIRRILRTSPDMNYDSLLIPASERFIGRNISQLWLLLRVHLKQMPAGSMIEVRPTTGAAKVTIPSLGWGVAEFRSFSLKFKYLCEETWDNRLYIVFPENSRRMPTDLRRRLVPNFDRVRSLNGVSIATSFPAIYCNIEVQLVGASDNPHITFDCYKIPAVASAVSFVNLPDRTTGQLDSNDIFNQSKGSSAAGTDIQQFPVAHEFGHALGLPHICADGSDPDEYGGTSQKAFDIMGRGNRVSFHHARLWTDRMSQHTTNRVPWQAVESSRYLSMLYQRSKDVIRARGKRINPRDTMP